MWEIPTFTFSSTGRFLGDNSVFAGRFLRGSKRFLGVERFNFFTTQRAVTVLMKHTYSDEYG